MYMSAAAFIRPRMAAIAACVFAFVVFFGGCSRDTAWSGVLAAIESEYPDVPRITTDSLAAWLDADSATRPILLDTRSPDEFDVSHLKGALRVDPDAKSFPDLDTLDRQAPIVAYCSVGYRSSDVVSRLQAAGFTNAHNLRGSIFMWANEGRPVYRDRRQVDEVHPYSAAWGRLLRDDLHPR